MTSYILVTREFIAAILMLPPGVLVTGVEAIPGTSYVRICVSGLEGLPCIP